ncbi:histidine kinase [Streptomyces bohaiensis]|uniref:histidine kinase n=1 Tax=Streptomyces bohaiensis TaxID=1431344 RepID=UPI003B7C89EB
MTPDPHHAPGGPRPAGRAPSWPGGPERPGYPPERPGYPPERPDHPPERPTGPVRWAELARDPWVRDILLGLVVLLLALVELNREVPYYLADATPGHVPVLLLAAAVTCHRGAPGTALLLGWAMLGWQVLVGSPFFLTQLAAVSVLYGAARYGGTVVVWLSGLSVVGTVVFVAAYAYRYGRDVLGTYRFGLDIWLWRIADAGMSASTLLLGALTVTSLPWLLGMVLRLRDAARASRERSAAAEQARLRAEADRVAAEEQRSRAEAQRSEAQEIAGLREGQARLARDVHDVVGHSLAVILAQAESAQFLADDDVEGSRRTMANIAVSARQSLRDVREVLASIAGPDGPGLAPTGSPDTLIEDVRAAGGDVRDHVIGTPRPLPSDVETVAFRVLQEMLTNALKHGVRGEPVLVERHWDDQLRIEVRNAVSPGTAAGVPGMGLEGMRARLETVGGRLSVARHPGHAADEETADDPATAWAPAGGGRRPDSWTATAWIPLAATGAHP